MNNPAGDSEDGTGYEGWRRTLAIMFIAQLIVGNGALSLVLPFLPLYVESLGTQNSIQYRILVWNGILCGGHDCHDICPYMGCSGRSFWPETHGRPCDTKLFGNHVVDGLRT